MQTMIEYNKKIMLAAMAGMIGCWFLRTITMFNSTVATLGFCGFFALYMGMLVLRIGIKKKSDMKTVLFLILLTGVCFMIWKMNGGTDVIVFPLLLAGCVDLDQNRIIKAYLVGAGVPLLLVMIAALVGKVENLVYTRGGKTRFSFGTTYPTLFAAQVLFLFMAYVFVKRKKLNYYDAVIGGVLAVFLSVFCAARTSVACIILFSIGVGIYVLLKGRNIGSEKHSMIPNWIAQSMVCAPATIALIVINLSYFYNMNSVIMNKINSLMSLRLQYGKAGFDIYDISLFGKEIPMLGYGGTVEGPANYFYLDSAFVNYLLQYGLLFLILFLLIMSMVAYRAFKHRNYILLWIIVIASVHGIMEDRLLTFATNPFLWLLFAKMTKGNKENAHVEKE